jgi:hypothetical protein
MLRLQLVFLLPQRKPDGTWLFWPVLEKDLRGCATALAYLQTTSKNRYVILGLGNQVLHARVIPVSHRLAPVNTCLHIADVGKCGGCSHVCAAGVSVVRTRICVNDV